MSQATSCATPHQASAKRTPEESSPHSPERTRGARWAAKARWALAVAACLWVALCTAIGPLYRQFIFNQDAASIARFSWSNAVILVCVFCLSLAIVVELTRYANGRRLLPSALTRGARRLAQAWIKVRESERNERDRSTSASHTELDKTSEVAANAHWDRHPHLHAFARIMRNIPKPLGRIITRCTDRWWKIMLILLIGWAWVPITLLTAFGADLHSQFREFSWAWNQWTGLKQPYIGFFSFVPMDIYPTAHYLWPANPTYLTDQHNIVLTLCYGAVAAMSRYLTGSNDWGVITLSAAQFVFAAFALASCANRFFNMPWLRYRAHGTDTGTTTAAAETHTVKALPRTLILLFLWLSPIVLFSTISLTKSPLFAFAFAWWFAVNFEIMQTRNTTSNTSDANAATGGISAIKPAGKAHHTRPATLAALVMSTSIMLISAKYAWYIVAFELVLMLLANRAHWKAYLVGLLLPLIVIHGGISLAISSGAVIGGDPIESHGVQLQQIARVARLNPSGIPDSARRKLEPIFNLDQMAEAYSQQDADPVKSSGIQSKKVSYKWRAVTKKDMRQFNSAWLEIVKANPVITTDALLAKSYGYFDITDQPYVSMTYYISNSQIPSATTWLSDWLPDWRKTVSQVTYRVSDIPVLGWLIHGNTYVIATLLIGAAEVVLRRWRTLASHMPLLLLMGVMLTAPANNFERHMLPLVFVFGFVTLTFILESRRSRHSGRVCGHIAGHD